MDNIKVSIIDGIVLSARFRERALVAVHQAIERSRHDLLKTLQAHVPGSTESENLAQYVLTLNAVKRFHESVDPKKSLEQEYRPAKSHNNADRRAPYGYACIVASEHQPLYTNIVAVTAAIAAGNCVILKEVDQPSEAMQFIRDLLVNSVSRDAFLHANEDPFGVEFQQKYRIAVESSTQLRQETRERTLYASQRLRAAVVDRSSDIQTAARACVVARFGFSGSSAYAPDIVLVNEFCIDEFCTEANTAALPFLTSRSDSRNEKRRPSTQTDGTVLAAGQGCSIVLLEKDNNRALQITTTATLRIMPVSSGEACINLLNKQDQPLLVNYAFADPPTAKYISQFIRASISVINHIPAELLVGPAAPEGFQTSLHPRFTPEMFSTPAPVLAERATTDGLDLVWPGSRGRDGKQGLENWLETTLWPVKEPFGPKVGFFEQGLLFGVGVILSSTVICCTLAVKYGYPVIARTVTRQR